MGKNRSCRSAIKTSLVKRQFLPDLENDSDFRLVKTFGRLKGRALSKNQKLGLEVLEKKFRFSLENSIFFEKKKKFG